MRVLIVTAELSPTALFDLVVAQNVSNVLDLRVVNGHAPRILDRVYHRPPKVLTDAVFRRVVSDCCRAVCAQLRCAECPSGLALMVLVDHERVEEVRGRVLALRPDAQVEVV